MAVCMPQHYVKAAYIMSFVLSPEPGPVELLGPATDQDDDQGPDDVMPPLCLVRVRCNTFMRLPCTSLLVTFSLISGVLTFVAVVEGVRTCAMNALNHNDTSVNKSNTLDSVYTNGTTGG